MSARSQSQLVHERQQQLREFGTEGVGGEGPVQRGAPRKNVDVGQGQKTNQWQTSPGLPLCNKARIRKPEMVCSWDAGGPEDPPPKAIAALLEGEMFMDLVGKEGIKEKHWQSLVPSRCFTQKPAL